MPYQIFHDLVKPSIVRYCREETFHAVRQHKAKHLPNVRAASLSSLSRGSIQSQLSSKRACALASDSSFLHCTSQVAVNAGPLQSQCGILQCQHSSEIHQKYLPFVGQSSLPFFLGLPLLMSMKSYCTLKIHDTILVLFLDLSLLIFCILESMLPNVEQAYCSARLIHFKLKATSDLLLIIYCRGIKAEP